MKKYVLFFGLAACSLYMARCVSFKVEVLPPTENQVEYICICKDIEESEDLLSPVEVQSEFGSNGNSIICLIRLKEVSREIQLRWKWFSPDKKLVKDSGNIPVNQDEKYLEVVTAYDKLEFDSQLNKSIKGQWTVAVFIDDELLGKRLFQIK